MVFGRKKPCKHEILSLGSFSWSKGGSSLSIFKTIKKLVLQVTLMLPAKIMVKTMASHHVFSDGYNSKFTEKLHQKLRP